MFYKKILDFVKSPEFVIDSVDLYESFEYDSLGDAIEDLFFFNIDMMAEMVI